MINHRRLIIWSIIGTGISSVSTQLLTIREFLSQFHGNEITISLVLFCWVLLTGIGSLAAKPLKRLSVASYSLLILIISVWPLLQIIVIRGFREIFFQHGTSPGFYPIFFYIIVTICLYCLLTGFILPCAQKVMQEDQYSFTSGDLYLTDSIGDITGGLLFSFVLVYWVKAFLTIAICSTLLILVGLGLLFQLKRHVFLMTALVTCSVFYYCSTNRAFENLTLSHQYGEVVRYLESPFGRIIVSKEGPQFTFWESGVPLYSEANVVNSEEKIHYPLCQLDKIENVLLVSGGLGETLDEVSKHRPAHVDYVELDPNLTDVALDLGTIKRARFLEIINTDGRRYIKMTRRRYDAVIIDLPDPDTFQINRFFTNEFFALAKKILNKGGILSISMEYAQNYISETRKKKLSTLYNTARMHFKNVIVLPGEEAYFICRDETLWSDIPARLKTKSIRTTYIEGFFYGNVTAERIKLLKDSLDENEYINTDFEPRLMNIVFQEWFEKHGTSPGYFAAILFVLTMMYIAFMKREEYILFSTGLATMGVEMLIVFAFQIIYGYVYLKIGAIVTAFLLGLLPGAIVGNISRDKDIRKLLFSEMFLLSLLLLFFVWIGYFKSELPSICFLVYCFCFSFVCGYQFPVAAGIIGEKKSPAAGCFAADLCGASFGTIATGTVLIPLLGIKVAVVFLILVKISSSMVIMVTGKKRV